MDVFPNKSKPGPGPLRICPQMRPGPLAVATCAAVLAAGCMPPEWGANGLLHPWRRHLSTSAPDLEHDDVAFRSDGLLLKGWLFHAKGQRKGLVVYLHGVADNRASGLWIARRFVPQGYDVLAYDSRAHGESEGENCTYGFYEKRDLSRALDAVKADRAVLIGTSLGAAVALQAAAEDPRIAGVVALSSFSDLETVARERAPWIATKAEIREAIAIAETRGHFRVADVSPVKAAAHIHVPVLVIHGQEDHETRPAHSQRIYQALAGPRQLTLVPHAGHNDVLGQDGVWPQIDAWLTTIPAASVASVK